MKRNTLLKVINPLLAALLAIQVLTGVFADALPREVFEIFHEGTGFALAGVGILHIILNWNWIKANYFGRSATAQG